MISGKEQTLSQKCAGGQAESSRNNNYNDWGINTNAKSKYTVGTSKDHDLFEHKPQMKDVKLLQQSR